MEDIAAIKNYIKTNYPNVKICDDDNCIIAAYDSKIFDKADNKILQKQKK